MHIVYDNIVFSLQKSGGISVVWQELLSRMMDSLEFDFSFIEYDSNLANPFRNKMDLSKGRVIMKKSFDLLVSRYFNPIIKDQEPFIFHSSYFRTCSNKRAINVTTVHDFIYEYFRTGLPKYIHSWQKSRAIRHSDAIVCVSNNTKKDLLKFFPEIDESIVHVIYNGVSEDYYVIENDEKPQLPFPIGSYLIFIGSRAHYKNFELVVRGVAKTNFNLLIVGSKLSEKEMEMVNSYLPNNKYREVGYLSNKDLNIAYNYAVALAYPSSYEGFGIPIIEAQRAGCPVIAYNGSSITEVIGETPLLMNELSDETFLSKLEMLSNKDVVSKIVHDGLENSKRFSWDKMSSDYIYLYKTLFDKRNN